MAGAAYGPTAVIRCPTVAKTSTPTTLISMRVPKNDLAIIDERARKAGVSRTELMLACAMGRRPGSPREAAPSQAACVHPIGRRIGKGCAACGKYLG